jgi:hypothetical protein
LNAFHWAANHGQSETVRLLIRRKTPLETRSMYGGTVLGTAVWSAINEPRPGHLQIIEDLLVAGARLVEAGYPTGHEEVDAALRRYGASSSPNHALQVTAAALVTGVLLLPATIGE